MVTINNIYKRFGSLQVLKDISLQLEPGKVHVIMGPNAAGKSTLMKMLVGLVIPDAGSISIMGESVHRHHHYRRHIGYMPQIARFPENMTVQELIRLLETIRGRNSHQHDLVEWLGLHEFVRKKLRHLSGGTQQKVNAVMALMYDCPVLLFDEPTVGLDPIVRLALKERIKEEKERGKTILLTTHIMSDIEEMADDIIFLMEGEIHFHDSPRAIKEKQQETTLEKAIANILSTQNR